MSSRRSLPTATPSTRLSGRGSQFRSPRLLRNPTNLPCRKSPHAPFGTIWKRRRLRKKSRSSFIGDSLVFRNPRHIWNKPDSLEPLDVSSDASPEIFQIARRLRTTGLLVLFRVGTDRVRVRIYSRDALRAPARHRQESHRYSHRD